MNEATSAPPAFGVWYRPAGGRRWYVVGSAPDADQARAKMYALMDRKRDGDWCVSPLDRPPAAWSKPARAGNQGSHSTR